MVVGVAGVALRVRRRTDSTAKPHTLLLHTKELISQPLAVADCLRRRSHHLMLRLRVERFAHRNHNRYRNPHMMVVAVVAVVVVAVVVAVRPNACGRVHPPLHPAGRVPHPLRARRNRNRSLPLDETRPLLLHPLTVSQISIRKVSTSSTASANRSLD